MRKESIYGLCETSAAGNAKTAKILMDIGVPEAIARRVKADSNSAKQLLMRSFNGTEEQISREKRAAILDFCRGELFMLSDEAPTIIAELNQATQVMRDDLEMIERLSLHIESNFDVQPSCDEITLDIGELALRAS